jgi:hypothetical protein
MGNLVPLEPYLPAVRPVGPVQYLHQGGLSRAVLPANHMDRTGPDIEVYPVKRPYAGESFNHIPHLQDTSIRFIHTKSFLQLYANICKRYLIIYQLFSPVKQKFQKKRKKYRFFLVLGIF